MNKLPENATDLFRRVARIIPHGAPADAVALYERLTAQGKRPFVVKDGNSLIVLHDIPTTEDAVRT